MSVTDDLNKRIIAERNAELVALREQVAALEAFRATCRKVVPIVRLSDDSLTWECPSCGKGNQDGCAPGCWVSAFEGALWDVDATLTAARERARKAGV